MERTPPQDHHRGASAHPAATYACCGRAPTPTSCSRVPASATASSSRRSTGVSRAPRSRRTSAPTRWPRCSSCSTAEGLVEDAGEYDVLTEHERGRYDRQLRYFADVAPDGLSAPDCQLRLRDASVLVLGVGGLGSWAALSLACCGVGRLTLVDGDEVELSNLNRQVLYSEHDIGRPKARVAAAAIERFNPCDRVVPWSARSGRRRDRERGSRQLARGGRRGPARPRHRALGERRLLRARRAVHHDEPLPALRARGTAVRARRDRLLQLPGAGLPAVVRALRPHRRTAPRLRRRRPARSARYARSSAGRLRSTSCISSPGLCKPASQGQRARVRHPDARAVDRAGAARPGAARCAAG